MQNSISDRWWKETFIYQIYPRSFKDSNGDGIGDIPGITQSLDYLKDLGVETLWISPIFQSPNDDNGYDVSDYCAIMPEFGTMGDFEELIRELKKRDMRVILDLVANHSSDEHLWFQEAKKSKDNPYRDYYIWKNAPEGEVPNNWISYFTGSAWEYNEATEDYYLHLFTKKQPDLNWENPKLRQEIYKAMRFWLDKGIDGFRMDVISLISKRPDFPNIRKTGNPVIGMVEVYANGPRVHEFLQEMHQEVLKDYDIYTVGEGIGIYQKDAGKYVDPKRKELDTIYHFDHMFLDLDPDTGRPIPLDWVAFKKLIREWDQTLSSVQAMNTFYLGNHDQPRCLSRFGDDGKYREVSAKMLAVLLMSQRAIPYLYQGDEFGMSNCSFESLEEFDDVWIRNQRAEIKRKGEDPSEALAIFNQVSRDHARTPMQWNDKPQAGFTEGKPWLKINPNYPEINAEAARKNPDSVWNFYKKLIALRKREAVLRKGSFQDLAPEHPQVFSYVRQFEEKTFWVILNLSSEEITYSPEQRLIALKYHLSNYNETVPYSGGSLRLRPYEAHIIEIQTNEKF